MSDSPIVSESEQQTRSIAAALARGLAAGSVLLLSGDLGAGKTAFVKGLAEGLGIDPDEVTSPTFTLVHEYRGGRLPLIHVDLYRLEEPEQVQELGLDEITTDGVLAVEWPERAEWVLPEERLVIRFEVTGEETRRLHLEPRGDRAEKS